jgi:hypothetical protein
MTSRYYFDIRSDDDFSLDEQGLQLTGQRAAAVEAASSLTEMMKDFPMIDGEPLKLVIEVRNEMGALFQISFTSEQPFKH